jgi:hypothetical protein
MILALICSCNNKPNNMAFKEFIAMFDHKELPYSLDSSFISKTTEQRRSPIDTTHVVDFIEENIDYGGGISLFDLYRYYPHVEFSVDNGLTAIVVEKVGGAGGVEKLFYLIVYSKGGKIIDKSLLAKEIGDCSRLQIWTSEIDKDFSIAITRRLLKGNCKTNEYKIEKYQREQYKLTKNGRIIKP